MKPKDLVFILISLVAVFLLILPFSSNAFFSFTSEHVLLGGFIKFFIFASYGDVLAYRLKNKHYKVPGILYKAIIWGILGIIITYIFRIFSSGIFDLQAEGLLPFAGITFFFALFTSLFMNVFFAPVMMLFHRVSDHYIEAKIDNSSHRIKHTIDSIDYQKFMSFVVFKTIPFFWIPAHTITFLLPETYRVFFASLLGIMLGLLLGIAKPKKEGG